MVTWLDRLGALVLAILLIGHSQMSVADPISSHIRKSPGADTVIVFVHGIMGDGVSTWTSESESHSYWPRMLTKDHAFDDVDIYVYSYPTGFWATLSIDELADNMRSTLVVDGVSDYPKIVFLSHSMGGLVTRAYLLKNRKVADRTVFAYFFSTPTNGSDMASIAQYLSSNPQLAKMKPLNVEDYLGDLQRQWLAAGSVSRLIAHMRNERRGAFHWL
jgi:triacylglycerol esterase/lipase EstA (alpha/beta hydrolase family)